MAASTERMWLLLVLCGSLTVCSAVDRNNFKTCDQSGFCKRHRDMATGASPYVVLLDQLTLDHSKATVPLMNKVTKVQLKLEIWSLKNNMARMRVTEMEPIKQRYEPPVGDVLIGEPAQDSLEKLQLDGAKAVFGFGSNKLRIQAEPFLIEVSTDDVPVMSINHRGLFKFEHYRLKNEPGVLASVVSWLSKPFRGKAEEEAEEGNEEGNGEEGKAEEENKEQPEEEEVEPGMWEETFKTHTDRKPHGPSSVGFDIAFPGFEFVYGIPEHADSVALKSTANTEPYRLFNLDVFEYELNNPMALYGSIPVMLAHNEERTVGMFFLNAAEMWVDIHSNKADKSTFSKLMEFVHGDQDIPQVDTHWIAESGVIDVFLMMGPTAKDVFQQYSSLTGSTPLPPLFSLAYHQCRWNYNDEKDVAQIDENFDAHDMPMDVIWLDIEHTDGKRYFTWDSVKFPHPAEMIANISAKGRKMVTIIDPHIKRDTNYHIHQEAQAQSLYVRDRDGNEYDGWCWPGSSSYLDFLDPKVREFWASKYQPDQYEGSTHDLFTWNDMNEPSVFNGPEITMHKDAKHYGGWEHRDIHNIYGMYQQRATVEGQLRRDPQQRPFVLTRAFFAGTQRYGAVWTGDNTAEWGHLKMSIPMLLSLNLVGITFSGADVGGFFKNPDAELMTRWYQAGAYQPFFRAHAHIETKRREPWLLPDENRDVIRDSLRARYRLLPYWYTLFHAAEAGGSPAMRPLWVEFPKDKSTFGTEDQYLVGPGLLVHPVTDAGATGVSVYLPGTDDVWYDMDTSQRFHGAQTVYVAVKLNKIPVFRRGGCIIPQRDRIRRSSSLTYHDPFTLVVALDKHNSAKGDLYSDDYNSFKYQAGAYIHRQFTFEHNKLTSKNLNPAGSFSTPAWIEKIIVIGVKSSPKAVYASVEGTGQSSLEFKYDDTTQVLIIRKPGMGVNKDFDITLS